MAKEIQVEKKQEIYKISVYYRHLHAADSEEDKEIYQEDWRLLHTLYYYTYEDFLSKWENSKKFAEEIIPPKNGNVIIIYKDVCELGTNYSFKYV